MTPLHILVMWPKYHMHVSEPLGWFFVLVVVDDGAAVVLSWFTIYSSSFSFLSSTSTTLLTPTSLSEIITVVSTFIPTILDLQSHNYYHWCHMFLVHLGRYRLCNHIKDNSVLAFSSYGSRMTSWSCNGSKHRSRQNSWASYRRTTPPPQMSGQICIAYSSTIAGPMTWNWRRDWIP